MNLPFNPNQIRLNLFLLICFTALVSQLSAGQTMNSIRSAIFYSKTDQLAPGEIVSFCTEGKHKISYHVYTPTSFNQQKLPPIVIALSSGGKGESILNSFKEVVEEMGWIGVGCDSLQNNMVVNDSIQMLMEGELLDDILGTIPHNTDRVYLDGNSGGGMRSYGITAHHPYRFAGVIAHGGWLGGPNYQDEPYQEGMDIAMLNGNHDMGAGAWTVIDTRTLKKRNCNVKHFTCMGGHVIAPVNVTLIAFKWLEEQWQMRRHPVTNKVPLKVLYVGSEPERTNDFVGFLENTFYRVRSVSADSITLALCNEADILVLDEPVYNLPDNYNKAMMLVGSSALNTGKRYGSKMEPTGIFDVCYALNPDTAKQIFRSPKLISPKVEKLSFNEETEKDEIWKVSVDGGGEVLLVNAKPFENAMDSEILLEGVADDGCRGALILREGSRLLWGDGSQPAGMTGVAKDLFINAMLWIYDFDGDRQSELSETTPRDSINSIIDRIDIREKKAMCWFPENVLQKCEYNKQKLKAYYQENKPYIFIDYGSGQLSVDRYALEFGTPNNEPESILKWIDLLQNSVWPETWQARYELNRYVNLYTRQIKDKRQWFEENKDKLEFSDEQGYRFINRNN